MIREACTCGATFQTDDINAVKLWREWRRKHTCPDTTEQTSDGTFTTSTALVEQAPIGFTLMHPGREDHSLDE